MTLATQDGCETVLAMNDALEALARESPQKAEIVRLRYFIGLENREIAGAMGISLSTVERSWVFSRSRLHRELSKMSGGG